ncbi:hypothetical protein pb186bvf_004838 [Paramecium bursaria]
MINLQEKAAQFNKETDLILNKQDERVSKLIVKIEQQCYDQSSRNLSLFSNCINKSKQVIEKQSGILQFKMDKVLRGYLSCIENQDENKCKQVAFQELIHHNDIFVNQIVSLGRQLNI